MLLTSPARKTPESKNSLLNGSFKRVFTAKQITKPPIILVIQNSGFLVFSKLTNRGALTELEIKQAMREVRIALLEADVNYLVVKNFINDVTQKAIGEKVLKSLKIF